MNIIRIQDLEQHRYPFGNKIPTHSLPPLTYYLCSYMTENWQASAYLSGREEEGTQRENNNKECITGQNYLGGHVKHKRKDKKSDVSRPN